MRVALSTFTYTWAVGVPGHMPENPLSAEALVHRAASVGVPVVQFGDNLDLTRLSPPELDSLVSTAANLGVDLEIGTRGIGEQLDAALQVAVRVGAPFVRVVLDGPNDHPDVNEARQRLAPWESAYREAGVRLAIENHDRFTARQLAVLISDLGDWAGVCLDTVNSFGALERPEVVVDVLGPLAVNLHIKDFVVRRPSHQMGFLVEGAPAGSGLLDIPWLVEALAEFQLVQTGVLELWTPPESHLDATIRKEASWAATSLEYLRTVPGLEFAS